VDIMIEFKEGGCDGVDGFVWLRMWSSDVLFWTWYWTLGFHGRWGIC